VSDADVTGAAPVVVRPVRPDEVERVGDLTVRAYVDGGGLDPDADYVQTLRRAGDRAAAAPMYVAVRGGVLVGAVSLCPYGGDWADVAEPRELELRMLVVEPEARGTGVADALIRSAVELARERGDERLVLSVIDDNVPAHRLYVRHGFVREPARDWRPVPEANLQTYTLPV
jgi:ribosomal protein S18 acetylase RimI-like enzyme